MSLFFSDRSRDGGAFRMPTRDLMTRTVQTVHPFDRIERAARIMRECNCGALPVVDDTGHLIGMITDRDITIRLVARGRDIRNARVEDAMTDETFSCHLRDDVEDCVESMARHQVRRMPIVDDRGVVVGIVSQSDLAQHARNRHAGEHQVAEFLSEVSEPTERPYR